ncbi:hypothetical protein VB773_05955 [Haloarculaceae archaeon H-GB2-1]|nr:hypothetical protein [Haloarculaceae archaeon H-GB1-1]MEA5389105.1 hypothetical protein [Haloarculaceae archaeon H-GB11]MEA5407166.1 hypothetical protein [Haloarculaceae archaeon H-GB2-1]
MFALPLQVIDGFLLKVNAGDALLVIYLLGLVATLAQRSRKLFTIHTITFGLILLITPSSLFAPKELSLLGSIMQYKFFGLVLLVVAPVLLATADR